MNEDVKTNIKDMEVPPMEMRRAPRPHRQTIVERLGLNPFDAKSFFKDKVLPDVFKKCKVWGMDWVKFELLLPKDKISTIVEVTDCYGLSLLRVDLDGYEYEGFENYCLGCFYAEATDKYCNRNILQVPELFKDGEAFSSEAFSFFERHVFSKLYLCDALWGIEGVSLLVYYGNNQVAVASTLNDVFSKGYDGCCTVTNFGIPYTAVIKHHPFAKENNLMSSVISYCRNRGYDGAYLAGVIHGVNNMPSLAAGFGKCTGIDNLTVEHFRNRNLDKIIGIQYQMFGYFGYDNCPYSKDTFLKKVNAWSEQGYDMYIIYCNTDTDFSTDNIQFTNEEIYPGIKIAYAE